ncbi:MAG: MerR family DNA-binding protein [Spirochaetia bacterium]
MRSALHPPVYGPRNYRSLGNYREYAEDTELVLRFIRICKTLGFTLREIKQYIDDIMGGHLTFGDLRAVIHTKIDAYMNEMELLTEKITKLESILQNCPTRLSVMDAIDKKQQSEVSA